MHSLQQKLLSLAQQTNLGQFTLRRIASLVGETSAQKVKHHLQQLEKRGLLNIDRSRGLIERVESGKVSGLLLSAQLLAIPILGAASAGPATMVADQNVEGYLRVSATLLRSRPHERLFALKVSGPSMNRAEVGGQRIEDGDYVIVDSEERDPRDRQIVVCVIDGLANIKRLHRGREHQQVILASESTQDFAPIYIDETDEFTISGTVVQVVKKPR